METVSPEFEDVLHNGNGNGNGHGDGHVEDGAARPDEDVSRLAAVVEGMLFAAGAPVPLARLVEALDGPGRAEVLRALEELGAACERDGRGVRLAQVAGGYQLRTAAEHAPWIRRLLRERPPRLSRPMLETLAIVAYRQPCTRLEIEAIRGVDADAVLATLTDRKLVRILGRKEAPGRPLLYGTTREFLEVFSLPDLGALPTLRELGDGAEMLMAADLAITPQGVLPTDEEAARSAAAADAHPEPEDAPVGDDG
jgi:segregation and condensation protein B